MTLTKNKTIREIGRRTRLKNRDVQLTLETLIDIWTEELVSGGRIELENFFVLETQIIDRGSKPGLLLDRKHREIKVPRSIRRISLRISKHLRHKLNIRLSRPKDSFFG